MPFRRYCYTNEFRARVLRAYFEEGLTAQECAQKFEINMNSVYGWVRRDPRHEYKGPRGVPSRNPESIEVYEPSREEIEVMCEQFRRRHLEDMRSRVT